MMCRMVNGTVQPWIYSLVTLLIIFRSEGLFVNITYVLSGVAKGAGKYLVSFWFQIKLHVCSLILKIYFQISVCTTNF